MTLRLLPYQFQRFQQTFSETFLFSLARLLLLFLLPLPCFGQQLHGVVLERESQKPVEQALIRAFSAEDKLKSYTYSDAKGAFEIEDSHDINYLKLSCIGYQDTTISITRVRENTKIMMKETSISLREVTITSRRIQEKGDTLAYSVAGFAMPQDRSIADVLAKMPGISIQQNGTIEYQGRTINKFYIEGMDLMNDRYTLASNNLDRRKVKTVEILKNHQPLATLRGKTFSEQAAINLVLEDDAKASLTGTIDVGAGFNSGEESLTTDNRLLAMLFQKQRQNFTIYKDNSMGEGVQREIRPVYLQEQVSETAIESSLFSSISTAISNIPAERSTFNRSFLAATNHLRRLSPDATLRTQVSYIYDKTRNSSDRTTQYFLSADSIGVVIEDYENQQCLNNLDASVCYELNSKTLYVKNQTKGSFHWVNGKSNIFLNGTSTDICSRPNRQYFQNTLQITLPASHANRIDLLSSFSFNNQPQRMTIYNGMMQYGNYRSTNSFNQISMINKLFGLYFHNKIRLEYYDKRLSTETPDVSSNTSDKQRGHLRHFIPTWETALHIKKESINLNASFALGQHFIQSHIGKLERLLPEWSISARYDISAKSLTSLAYTRKERFPELQRIYNSPFFLSYRMQTLGNMSLYHAPSHNFVARYEYAHPVKGFFMTLRATYGIQQKKSILQTSLTDGLVYSQSFLPYNYNSNNATVSLKLSKSLNWQKTFMELSARYTRTNDKKLTSDVITNVNNNALSAALSIAGKPSQWLSYEAKGSIVRSQMSGINIAKTKTTNVKEQIDFFFQIAENLSLGWKNQLQHHVEIHDNAYFSDLSLLYRLKRIDIELIANNIFGVSKYEHDLLTADYYIINNYRLRSRDLLLKVCFGF